MSKDYDLWHSTMVSEFGQHFNRRFRGHMWSDVSQDVMKNPLHVRLVIL